MLPYYIVIMLDYQNYNFDFMVCICLVVSLASCGRARMNDALIRARA